MFGHHFHRYCTAGVMGSSLSSSTKFHQKLFLFTPSFVASWCSYGGRPTLGIPVAIFLDSHRPFRRSLSSSHVSSSWHRNKAVSTFPFQPRPDVNKVVYQERVTSLVPTSIPSYAPLAQLHTERPLSPHLTIFNLGLTGNMSILHRFTGAFLTGAFYVTSVLAAVGFKSMDFVHWCSMMPSPLFWSLKTLLIFPFTYHTFNGIRHFT
ncbi:hypothetical protein HMI54_015702 [Coelomomyces lativittatus]|nr:hypothetical protein HMI54_015702 [Coelomomyces lativittatus]